MIGGRGKRDHWELMFIGFVLGLVAGIGITMLLSRLGLPI